MGIPRPLLRTVSSSLRARSAQSRADTGSTGETFRCQLCTPGQQSAQPPGSCQPGTLPLAAACTVPGVGPVCPACLMPGTH